MELEIFNHLDEKYPYIANMLEAEAPSISYDKIQDDIYNSVIDKVSIGLTKKGDKALKTVFIITDEAYKDRKAFITLIIPSDNTSFQFNQLFNYILQLNPSAPSISYFLNSDLSVYSGKNCIIELKTNKAGYQLTTIKKIY